MIFEVDFLDKYFITNLTWIFFKALMSDKKKSILKNKKGININNESSV